MPFLFTNQDIGDTSLSLMIVGRETGQQADNILFTSADTVAKLVKLTTGMSSCFTYNLQSNTPPCLRMK